MLYIGIDPGANGGVAVLRDIGAGSDHRGVMRVEKLPPTIAEVFALLQGITEGGSVPAFAVLENVHAFPRMGAVSAFTFGRGFGNLEALLHAAGIAYDLVAPQKWQGHLGCLSKRDKNVTKRRAQELFPMLKVIHAHADALLMAEYCRRLRTSTLAPPLTKATA